MHASPGWAPLSACSRLPACSTLPLVQVLDKTSTRKLMQTIASVGPAACLVKLAADQGCGSVPSLDSAVRAWERLLGPALPAAPALRATPLWHQQP